MPLTNIVIVLVALMGNVLAGGFEGAAFPPPKNFSSSKTFQTAAKNFDKAIDELLTNGLKTPPLFNGLPLNETSFSIAMFSASQSQLLYERHYTDLTIRNSTSASTNVDGNSVFRIGSISKLVTVYLLLALDKGLARLNDLVIDYIPELLSLQNKIETIPALPSWSDITVGDLATHLSGIARDYALNDVAYEWEQPLARLFGLPKIDSADIARCDHFTGSIEYIACTSKAFIQDMANEAALFPPGLTPAYSNNGFSILGIVIGRIYGSNFPTLLQREILGPLGMINTFAAIPDNEEDSIIPVNATASGWDNKLGAIMPAAGMYSSTNDLAAMGSAILNSTLLFPTVTRRWMKPHAFTASSMLSVGAPWEIRRVRLPSRIVTQYTKDGNWGAYAGYLTLLPDYDVGFALLGASLPRPQSQGAMWAFREMIDSIWLPALEEIAREQANAAFGGTYRSQATNSSMTINTDGEAGLLISSWITNGVNVLQTMRTDLASFSPDSDPDIRLYPNKLYPTRGDIVGFAASMRWLSGPYPIWESIDGLTDGSIGIDNFVFYMDESNEQARAVESLAYRDKLQHV